MHSFSLAIKGWSLFPTPLPGPQYQQLSEGVPPNLIAGSSPSTTQMEFKVVCFEIFGGCRKKVWQMLGPGVNWVLVSPAVPGCGPQKWDRFGDSTGALLHFEFEQVSKCAFKQAIV